MSDRSTTPSDSLRDAHLDSLWRAASTETPAPTLDAEILALARREADGVRHTRRGAASAPNQAPRHWWPLAAAATLGALAFGIVQMWPAERGERATVSDMPWPAARSPAPSSIASQPASPAVPAPAPAAGRPSAPASAATATAPQSKIIDVAPTQASEAGARRNAPKRKDSGQPLAKTTGNAVGSVTANGGPMKAENALSDEIARKPSTVSDNALPFVPDPKPALPAPAAAATAAAAPAEMRRQEPALPPLNDALTRENAPTAARAISPALENAPVASRAVGSALENATPASRAGGEMDAKVAKRDRASAEAPARLPTADWIALIRRLRDEGKIGDAKRELASFRRAHSDAESLLPADLREWQPAR